MNRCRKIVYCGVLAALVFGLGFLYLKINPRRDTNQSKAGFREWFDQSPDDVFNLVYKADYGFHDKGFEFEFDYRDDAWLADFLKNIRAQYNTENDSYDLSRSPFADYSYQELRVNRMERKVLLKFGST